MLEVVNYIQNKNILSTDITSDNKFKQKQGKLSVYPFLSVTIIYN